MKKVIGDHLRRARLPALTSVVFLLIIPQIQGRVRVSLTPLTTSWPGDSVITRTPWLNANHQINRLNLMITNAGTVGAQVVWGGMFPDTDLVDVFTGKLNPPLEYPRGSGRLYWQSVDLWVGAQTPRHRKFVTTSQENAMDPSAPETIVDELLPDDPPGKIIRRSILPDDPDFDPAAVGEEDLVAKCSDVREAVQQYTNSRVLIQPNQDSIPVRLTQISSGWSAGYAADFILVNLKIKYTGTVTRDSVYLGLDIDPNASYGRPYGRPRALLCGYLGEVPSIYGCNFVDTVNVFWGCSSDGIPYGGRFVDKPIYVDSLRRDVASVRGNIGIRMLQAPLRTLPTAFNWWGASYYEGALNNGVSGGPSKSADSKAADFGRGEIASSDEELYDLMSNGEFDFDPIYWSSINRRHTGEWQPVDQSIADTMSCGLDWLEMLLSWGPFTAYPGAEFDLTYALVGGEHFHVDPNNLARLPSDPQGYYDHVDFSDLAQNALMAGWVYDNPGVDTDGDGYRGKFRVCVLDSDLVDGNWVATKADTQWYKGDGVPDYRGTMPPPSPKLWVTPTHNGLKVRFNGQYSETEKDIFLQIADWEGYRIYIGRDDRETSLSLVGSYDKLDFDKYYYNYTLPGGPEWQLLDEPFTLDSLRCLYGSGPDPCNDSSFDPLIYTEMHRYHDPGFPDSIFMFKAHDYNTSDLGVSTPVKKVYPNMPDPRTLPADSITPDMYTDDGYLKYYEYEMDIENLLPSVQYYVCVTAFDFGSPAQGLDPLESSKRDNLTPAFPLHDLDQPVSGSDKVYVYPNPYRIDADYRANGYEGRAQDDKWGERVRAIWFANLPPRCTIKIFTLDGDRVKTIEHDKPITDPTYSRERWDMINRNMQMVVSGLYYWTVEIPDKETQIGKLVIIR